MEVSALEGNVQSTHLPATTACRSSFECDGEQIDAILGQIRLGQRSLRFDAPHASSQPSDQLHVLLPSEPYVIEEQPARNATASNSEWHSLERSERIARLLKRDQAWYEARQTAIRKAEQSLALLELQQHCWLVPTKS
jgi:hypothetical protein